MKRLLFGLLFVALLLSGCARPWEQLMAPARERQAARETLNSADAVLVGVMGRPGDGYREGDRIYTDYSFQADRAENAPAGTNITIKMSGGTVVDPTTGITAQEIVDHITPMPGAGDEAFLVLRKTGEKYIMLDAMVLKAGQPVHRRAANSIYLPVLEALRK
ncbi:MAG TPA: hypothetical protein VK464_10340 [Symbiobacteriaceae bacterium]|jgi:hypothetical protein|nr:hypothetical protein [Symbiobacteriaceae bacterium]